MANINPIRIEIERVLRMTFSTSYVDKCPTKKHPDRYRLKLTPYGTEHKKREAKVKELPHVLKVEYTDGGFRTPPGIAIYFDCKPSIIKV